MGPLLFVWTVPTVILYALLLGAYKASGLLERLTIALHPLLRPFGLSGRDLVRVMMGFGCNVPAVISTRSCSGCTRQTCISLYQRDRVWFGLFLSIWGNFSCFQCGETPVAGNPLFTLFDNYHPHLHSYLFSFDCLLSPQ